MLLPFTRTIIDKKINWKLIFFYFTSPRSSLLIFHLLYDLLSTSPPRLDPSFTKPLFFPSHSLSHSLTLRHIRVYGDDTKGTHWEDSKDQILHWRRTQPSAWRLAPSNQKPLHWALCQRCSLSYGTHTSKYPLIFILHFHIFHLNLFYFRFSQCFWNTILDWVLACNRNHKFLDRKNFLIAILTHYNKILRKESVISQKLTAKSCYFNIYIYFLIFVYNKLVYLRK